MNRLNRLYERIKHSPDYRRRAARAALTADLRILISNAGKSQKEVADAIGISPAAMSSKLSGDKNLTLDSIVDIAGALGADFDIVFRPQGTPHARQMWDVDAQTNGMLDKAAILLGEVEVMHAKQQAMQKTWESISRTRFRSNRGRQLTAGFHTARVCANDGGATLARVANEF